VHRLIVRALIVLGLLGGVLVAAPATPAVALPDGFVEEPVVDVPEPTAFAFSPAGLLVTSQPGQLRLVREPSTEAPALVGAPVIDLGDRLCSDSERGLLGVAVPPDAAGDATAFPVVLFFTERGPGGCDAGATNAVSRFTYAGGAIDPDSEVPLLRGIPSPGGNHNAGDVGFGADGMLYVTVGDGATGDSGSGGANDAARDRSTLLGKVLRITPDGGVPEDNPFVDAAGAVSCADGSGAEGEVCTETFAWGLRNPFRIAFDPNADGTRFRINDVGQDGWEEIDEGQAGADYGWNACEGAHDNPDAPGTADCTATGPYTPPVHEYSHDDGCASITGGAFVPDGAWPSEYDGAYLYGDFVCGRLFSLPEDGGTPTVVAEGLGAAVHLGFGPAPDGTALYYTTYEGDGQIRRIRPPAAEPTPTPTPAPTPTSEPTPTPGPPARPPIERVGGDDRIATAVAVSGRGFADCALEDGGTVVLARADAYPDALAGGPLAVALGGPVLLTGPDGLAGATAAELDRLCAGDVVLLGREVALGEAVADAVAATGATADRIGGDDRFATAALVADALPPSPTAYVVEGIAEDPARGWPDAVSASWVAAGEGAPVLLSGRDELPAATAAALTRRGVSSAVVVGGSAALSPTVADAVAALTGDVERVAGADRYGTSRALADRAGAPPGPVFLATGLAYPDALSAGPAVAAEDAAMLLVDGRDLTASADAAAWLGERAADVRSLVVVGGEEAVSDAVAAQAASAVEGR